MAPGAFERAHPSPRANADPGPTGGTAPDSPRAFLAAMEDGVYGRPGGAGPAAVGWRLPCPPPPANEPSGSAARALGPVAACLRHKTGFRWPKSGAFQAIVWAEPVSGGGGRGRDGAGGAARTEPNPPGVPEEPSACGAGTGVPEIGEPGRNLGGSGDPPHCGRGALDARSPFPNSYTLTAAAPAISTFHGLRSPDARAVCTHHPGAQARSYLTSYGVRKPRPQPPSK